MSLRVSSGRVPTYHCKFDEGEHCGGPVRTESCVPRLVNMRRMALETKVGREKMCDTAGRWSVKRIVSSVIRANLHLGSSERQRTTHDAPQHSITSQCRCSVDTIRVNEVV